MKRIIFVVLIMPFIVGCNDNGVSPLIENEPEKINIVIRDTRPWKIMQEDGKEPVVY